MICKKCGNPLNEGEMVCSKCGEKVIPDSATNPNTVSNAQGINNVPNPINGAPVGGTGTPTPNGINAEPPTPANNNVGAPISNGIVDGNITNQNIANNSVNMTDPINGNNIPNQSINPTNPQQLNQQNITPPTPDAKPAPTKEKKKGGNGIFIFIIILLLAVIGGLVFYILKGSQNGGNQTTDGDTPATETTEPTETTDTTETEQVSNSNTETVGGLTVTIPEGINHTTEKSGDNEVLLIMDKKKTMLAQFQIFNEDPTQYLTVDAITKYATNAGITNGSATVTKYGDYTYSVYHSTYNNSTLNLFIGKIEDKAAIGMVAEGNNYNGETAFGYISTITKSATGTPSSGFSGTIPKIGEENSFLKEFK